MTDTAMAAALSGSVAEGVTLHGNVLEANGGRLPQQWVGCDLRDTVWPREAGYQGFEFVDCDLSGSTWDEAFAPDLRILGTERGRAKVHGMSMRRATMPGLTMVRVVGLKVDMREATVDDCDVRQSSLIRLQAQRLHGENCHFCTHTILDESDWERAVCPAICLNEASLVNASLRYVVFC